MRIVLLFMTVFIVSHAALAGTFRFAAVNENSLGLWEGERPVLVYNHGVIRHTNAPVDRARSSYVHPIYGLDGEVLTDDFPSDHYHHRGLFWAWPHVQVGAREVDLWMLRGIRHEFQRELKREANEAHAVLGVRNGWFIGSRQVVDEQVWLRVWPATAAGQAIDVELVWTPLAEPLTLRGAEDKSYGGLTLRFAPHAKPPVITVPTGRTKEDLSVTPLPWADFTAKFSGATAPSGAAVFIAPTHPDYPLEWLTRHYGVLCVGWPGVQAQTFPPGQPMRGQYRVWIHRGNPAAEEIQAVYQDYARSVAASPPLSATGPKPTKP